ncbi:MAG: hypothetical protein ACSHX5_08480 [Phycisphaerales bacterium]
MTSKVYQADWLDQLPTGIDFRHRCNTLLADQIISRSIHLKGPDRAFVEAMYRDGHSAAQIARLGDLDPRQVRRRIKLALARLSDPLFIFVITHQSNWSTTRRKVAQSLFQAGHSIRQTADHLELKVHQVRRHRTAILDLYQSTMTSKQHSKPQSPNRAWRTPKI